MPAANRTSENVHEHGQVDELMPQPDVGDVGDPNVIRPRNFQVFDEVRIAWEGVVAVGGALAALGRSTVDAEFLHPAADAFGVHRPAEPAHHGGEPAIAVGGPLAGQVEQGRLEHGLVINSTAHLDSKVEYKNACGL